MKNIIWDWNGTLINDVQFCLTAFNQILEDRQLPILSLDTYRNITVHPISKIYEAAGIDLKIHKFENLADEWHQKYSNIVSQINLHSDSVLILDKFKSAGFKQYILSAHEHQGLTNDVNNRGLSHYFESINGLTDKLGKSKVDLGRSLFKDLEKSNTYLIGDTGHDFEVAQALNINCILVNRGFESRERLGRHGVPVVDNFQELLRFF